MKGFAACFLCAALLFAAVLGSPIDKPKKNLKKYLYKKQGPLAEPLSYAKTKPNGYSAGIAKVPRGEKSFPPFVVPQVIDDEVAGGSDVAASPLGIHDFFDRISRTFGRNRARDSESEQISIFPADDAPQGNPEIIHENPHAKPTAFPSAPIPPDHPQKDEEGNSAERDDEDSGSEEDQEENEEENEENDNDDEPENEEEQDEEENDVADDDVPSDGILPAKEKPKKKITSPPSGLELDNIELLGAEPVNKKPSKNKNKVPEKEKVEEEQDENQEGSDEEDEENDDAEEPDLPDNVPPFIRQSMIEDYKRKKQEQAQGGNNGGRPSGNHGGRPGGPGGNYNSQQQQPYGGRPGQGPQSQAQPPRGGGFLSSLFS